MPQRGIRDLTVAESLGVRVAALQISGAVRFVVNGPTSGNVHLCTAQFETVMDDTRSLAIAKAIVAAKLQNSSRVVGRWSRDEKNPLEAEQLASRGAQIRERIARLVETDTADHVRGVEGDAARIYFRAIGQAVALRRNINAVESYRRADIRAVPAGAGKLAAMVGEAKLRQVIRPDRRG